MSALPARPLPAPPRPSPSRTPATRPVTRPSRPRLRVVPDPPRREANVRSQARRAPFVVLVCALLVTGLVGVLVLNSLLTQNSYRIHNLQKQTAQLADTEQALRHQVAQDESPAQLRQRAVELGMVPASNPVFVADDGTVLGVPSPAPTPVPSPAPTSAAGDGR